MEKIFVYGTLRKKGKFHEWLKDAKGSKFLGMGRLEGWELWKIHPYGYPAIRMASSNLGRMVDGEIWEVEGLDDMDYVEGHPFNYVRVPLPILKDSGKMERMWVYIWPFPITLQDQLILGGDWLPEMEKEIRK